jgi:hypothetical protein
MGAFDEVYSDQAVGQIVVNATGPSQGEVATVTRLARPFSTLWFVTVRRDGVEEKYVAKLFPSNARRHCALSGRADRLFKAEAFHSPADARIVDGLMISRHVELPRIQDALTNGGWAHPVSWIAGLEANMRLAGHWLHRYHAGYLVVRPVAPALSRYVMGRSYALEYLPATMRDRFLSAVANCPDSVATVTHSDFSPRNILTDGHSLGVVDFGIQEWVYMSPYWDVATLIMSLRTQSRFYRRSLMYWLPSLHRRLEEAFFTAYGHDQPPASREWHICACVRYFGVFSGAAVEGDPRAHWYREKMQEHLSKAISAELGP